jgi:hypothetical protein
MLPIQATPERTRRLQSSDRAYFRHISRASWQFREVVTLLEGQLLAIHQRQMLVQRLRFNSACHDSTRSCKGCTRTAPATRHVHMRVSAWSRSVVALQQAYCRLISALAGCLHALQVPNDAYVAGYVIWQCCRCHMQLLYSAVCMALFLLLLHLLSSASTVLP